MDSYKELEDIKETTEIIPEEFIVQGTNYKCKLTVLAPYNSDEDTFEELEWRLRINETLVTDLPPAPPI